jgi:Lrp/AsnC family transcriptional regulator, leucine-responsive regulatory protein
MRRSAKLDAVDRRILAMLQADARTAMSELAAQAGVSAPACYRRVRRLRETGVIARDVAVVAPRTLGWALSMIVLVTLEREAARTAHDIIRRLEAEPTVVEAWLITGEYDFAVRMIARDMEEYDELTHRLFVQDEHVRSFKTLVVVRQAKTAGIIPAAEDM